MRRTMMKSKIHRATVTAASIDYEGSITIDSSLMEAAEILPHEQVHVLDINNGARLVTYAIPGGAGEICINGAAARLVDVGDLVIIISYAEFSSEELRTYRPRIVKVDAANRMTDLKAASFLDHGRERSGRDKSGPAKSGALYHEKRKEKES